MIFELIRKLDRWETFRRRIKRIRNLVIDPLPRKEELIFEGYDIRHPQILFRFRAGKQHYTNSVLCPKQMEQDLRAIDSETWNSVLTTIGLAIVPFHFLLSDFAAVKVNCSSLTRGARDFFEKYFRFGLAEFRYRQGLDPTRAIRVYTNGTDTAPSPKYLETKPKTLMLNGGGKDSAVMAELLKMTGIPCEWCSVNPGVRHQSLIKASGIEKSHFLGVKIDSKIYRNARYPWGHVPYTGLNLCLSLLPTLAYHFRYVAVGNEYSASFGNTKYKGMEVNHQFSKSYAFELLFSQYVLNNIVQGVSYFSVLRPFFDIRLASMLARLDHYFGAFISCNNGPSWCKTCPKCAFTYLALLPFIEKKNLITIFEEDLFARKKIRMLVLDLARGRIKPWECVGTQEECRLALALTLQKYSTMNFPVFPRRSDFEAVCRGLDLYELQKKYLREFHGPHNIPQEIWGPVRKKAQELTH